MNGQSYEAQSSKSLTNMSINLDMNLVADSMNSKLSVSAYSAGGPGVHDGN